jgi:spore coat polysaccharide biosynthesis predicted glycosyltransferase SpsG
MRYILRADASQSIGSGHVMRSSAIAEELIARGECVVFVGQISDLPWVKERITSLGFSHIYRDPENFSSDPTTDILLLDSYEIAVDDPFIRLKKWLRVVVIVDQLTPDYSCHLRIHPGLDSSWIGDSSIPILAGPQYIPFRSSILINIAKPKKNSEAIKVVVVAGGADPHESVLQLSRILTNFTEPFEAYLFTNSLDKFPSDSRFHFCEIGLSLDEVSKDADLVLTTSSTSSLEFIARGLCVGIVCAVENQKQHYDDLGQIGIAAQIGTRTRSSIWEIEINTIQRLITDSGFRASLTEKAHGLIDFHGAHRIAEAMFALSNVNSNQSG